MKSSGAGRKASRLVADHQPQLPRPSPPLDFRYLRRKDLPEEAHLVQVQVQIKVNVPVQ